MSEQWAYCERCHRWFYAQRDGLDTHDDLRCPVCDASPTMVRDTPADTTAPAS